MIKLIGWEFKKMYHSLKYLFFGYGILLLLLWLLPEGLGTVGDNQENIFMLTVSILLTMGIFGLGIYPIVNMVLYFSGKHYHIEKLKGIPCWKIMIAKIPVNILVIFIATGIATWGMQLMDKFETENIGYFEMNMTSPIYVMYLESAIFIPVLFTFIYLVVSERKKYARGFLTVVIVGILWSLLKNTHTQEWKLYIVEAVLLIPMIWRAGRIADLKYEQA